MKDLRQLALTGEDEKVAPVKTTYKDNYDDWSPRGDGEWRDKYKYGHDFDYSTDDSAYGSKKKETKVKRSNSAVKLTFSYDNEEIGPYADSSEVTYSYTKTLERVEDMAIEDLKKINKSVEKDFAIVMNVEDTYDKCIVKVELVRIDVN